MKVSFIRFSPVLILAIVVASSFLAATLLVGQASPKISSVDPATGKVSDAVTVKGESLAKGSVAGVFLSDDKADFKAEIVEQAADKIVFKVPQVKAGDYNVSIQVGNNILIQPLRFAVQ